MPAKLFGLYPRKGTIQVGADADLVLWDPRQKVDLSHEHLHMRVDYSIYPGRVVQGAPERVFLRGHMVKAGDRFVGQRGMGRYLRRDLPLFS
jgi:dihydropyrimidinase